MHKRSVLIMDDDVELCEGIAEFLRDEGYHVQNASDPMVGESLIEQHEFDIALLDFKMGKATGIDILRKIKIKNSKTKIYFLTGRPFIEQILEKEKVSHWVDGIISKPFKASELLEKLAESY